MKVRFDTYTKNTDAAINAFKTIAKHCTDVSLSKTDWNNGAINLSGEVDSKHMDVLEQATANDFNEDVSQL